MVESKTITYNELGFLVTSFNEDESNKPYSGHDTVIETVRIRPEGGLRNGYRVPDHKRLWNFPAMLLENLRCGDTVISLEQGLSDDEEYRKDLLWSSNKMLNDKVISDVYVPMFYDLLIGNDESMKIWRTKLRDGRGK